MIAPLILNMDPQGADALALLHEAWLDARALYPDLFAGKEAKAPGNPPLGARSVYVVAYLDGQPLACGSIVPFGELYDTTTAEVRRMYVHRDHRRRGLGRAVLAHLEREALRLGFARLVLETGHRQQPAMQLYEADGFRRIPPFGPYADDPTSVCYERTLLSPDRRSATNPA
jgi:GNAT superfamily N-acetyltransferase